MSLGLVKRLAHILQIGKGWFMLGNVMKARKMNSAVEGGRVTVSAQPW